MPKWEVTFYYSTFLSVAVEAADEDEAVEMARDTVIEDLDTQLRANLQPYNDCEVRLLGEGG